MRNVAQYPITSEEVDEFLERSWYPQDPPLIGGMQGLIKFGLQHFFKNEENMKALLDSMKV